MNNICCEWKGNHVDLMFWNYISSGAFGYFEVTHDITKYCKAKVFEHIGKRTPIAIRFSTVGKALKLCIFIYIYLYMCIIYNIIYICIIYSNKLYNIIYFIYIFIYHRISVNRYIYITAYPIVNTDIGVWVAEQLCCP